MPSLNALPVRSPRVALPTSPPSVRAERPTAFPDAARWFSHAWDVWLGGWQSPLEIERRGAARLRELVSFARAQVPLYRQRYRALPPHGVALQDLPPVCKGDLMRDIEASLSDRTVSRAQLLRFLAHRDYVGRPFMNRYAVWTTSGTTGKPGIFLHDADALAVYEALQMFRFRRISSPAELALRIASGERFAMVAATGGHFAGVSSVEHLRTAYPWLAATLRSFSLLQPWPALVAQLNAYRPTQMATYPTAAEVLAEEQDAGRLKLGLRELWTGGECLCPATRRRLERSFGCPVRDEYGASEFMSIAWDCGHGNLHVNSDWVLLEPVDAQWRPVDPGVPSHTVLLTNLANRVQPLLRYDLGDSVTVSPEPCPCGNRLPAIRVEGRHDDTLAFADASGRSVKLLPLVLSTVLEEDAHVNDFQLVKTAPAHLAIRLGACEHARAEAARAALRAHLQSVGLAAVKVALDGLPPQRDAASGKLRRVMCSAGCVDDPCRGTRAQPPHTPPAARPRRSATRQAK
jgi:phenylacetate-coenzyme A ligase PaaK-like adenylate-forming protein